MSCLIHEIANDNSYELRQVLKNIISKIGIFNTCQILACQFQSHDREEEEEKCKNEDLPFQFNKFAYNLGFLKKSQMNEYNDRLANLKYSCSSYSDTEKVTTPQYKDSFSFNPFKNLKNLHKNENVKLEEETPLLASELKSETNSKKTKNELFEEGIEKGDPIMYSPSSYSGILNSHESSMRGKEIKDEDGYFNNGNMIMIEKEHEDVDKI